MANENGIINELLSLAREVEINRDYVRKLRAHLLVQKIQNQLNPIQFLLWRSYYYVNGKGGEQTSENEENPGHRVYTAAMHTLDVLKTTIIEGKILGQMPEDELNKVEGVFLQNKNKY